MANTKTLPVYYLQLGNNWLSQIEKIREGVTLQSKIKGPGGKFFRVLNPNGGKFKIHFVSPRAHIDSGSSTRLAGVSLIISGSDLYVEQVGNHNSLSGGHNLHMYAQQFFEQKLTLSDIDGAILSGDNGWLSDTQTMSLVLCIAESIRRDDVAAHIYSRCSGADPDASASFDMPFLETCKDNWSQPSQSIWQVIHDKKPIVTEKSAKAKVAKGGNKETATDLSAISIEIKSTQISGAHQEHLNNIAVLAEPNVGKLDKKSK
jgi:hypothetical protein